MAYVIKYGGQVPAVRRLQKSRRGRWIAAACVLAAAAALRYFWGDTLLSIFLPGDDEATVEAFSNMVSAMGNAQTFSECVTAFCREVIYGPS